MVAAACKKSENPTPRSIVGKWELSLEVGGIAGITNHYAPGNGNILQLNADNTYQTYKQGSLLYHGTYQIIKSSITFGTNKFDGIYYDHSMTGDMIQLQNDTLIIGMDYDDGIASSYIRQ
jgi:hypothetical protein